MGLFSGMDKFGLKDIKGDAIFADEEQKKAEEKKEEIKKKEQEKTHSFEKSVFMRFQRIRSISSRDP